MTVDIIVLICGIVIVLCAYILGRIDGAVKKLREITGDREGPNLVLSIALKDITEERAEEIRQTLLEAKEIYHQKYLEKGEKEK